MHLPLVDIVPATNPRELQSAIDEAWSFDWIVFTSVNGVDHFCRQMRQRKLNPRALGSAKLACHCGPQQKKHLKSRPYVCDLFPDMFLYGRFRSCSKPGREGTAISSYSSQTRS
jgi:Uroporphyrinogen-III synthase